MATNYSRNLSGLAAEYAVASELCRRKIYAQLTLGNQKKTDILVFSEEGEVARLEVKSKQNASWPNCGGIFGFRTLLVFVDFQNREPWERPDFYVLTVKDWRKVLESRVNQIKSKNPETNITITDENVSVFVDQIGKSGKPYRGMDIRTADISEYKEAWDKVTKVLSAS